MAVWSPKYGVDAATSLISKEMLLPQISSSHPHFGIMFALLPISLLPISPSTGPKHFHGFSTNRAARRHPTQTEPADPKSSVDRKAANVLFPAAGGPNNQRTYVKTPEKNERMMENWKTPSPLEKMYLLY